MLVILMLIAGELFRYSGVDDEQLSPFHFWSLYSLPNDHLAATKLAGFITPSSMSYDLI